MKLLPKVALSGLLALSLSGLTHSAQAQVTINVNPPSWGRPLQQAPSTTTFRK
ncbi:hypothetical protein MUN84_12785 [Hymenobacter sp. 5516J-16]|uniref:hypothetical protein n=1 Tax=Hymenobacter sp. 5516J-16 TaxID=2932253 RepID=UPI001FD31C89|nr:hypothetical protein [Hymenobacter sp. 5516J-16]UOQ75564.1 hypothetical protein MUN84_12785 [Hymenobacter sp. 5516J-16]